MKIHFAVVGQGHIGKRHAEMARRNTNINLVAVCDIMAKENLGLDNITEDFFNDIDEMFAAHPEIDVVSI